MNLEEIAQWISAKKYSTDFRPIKLVQKILHGKSLKTFSQSLALEDNRHNQNLQTNDLDSDAFGFLAYRAVSRQQPMLFFGTTRQSCEIIAMFIAKNILTFYPGNIYKILKFFLNHRNKTQI